MPSWRKLQEGRAAAAAAAAGADQAECVAPATHGESGAAAPDAAPAAAPAASASPSALGAGTAGTARAAPAGEATSVSAGARAVPSAGAGASAALGSTPTQGEPIEVVAQHAIQGTEIKVVLPKHARFKHVKVALARHLGSEEVMSRGQLMKKENGVYHAFKDAKRIGEVRHVLVVCADFGSSAERQAGARCSLGDDDVSEEEVETALPVSAARGPARIGTLTRSQALALQQELLDGFSAPAFQEDLKALEQRRTSESMPTSEFIQERQDLFLKVQGQVLPRFGFEGSTSGVYKMMGAMGSFVKDPEFKEKAVRINQLIGLESPPDTWGDLAKSCQKLETPPQPLPTGNALARRPAGGGSRLLGFGGGFGFGPPARGLGAMMPPQVFGDDLPPPARRGGGGVQEQLALEPPAVKPWPAGKPPPFTLHVAGTFNKFSPTEMDWDAEGGLFVCPMQVCEKGWETFQLVVNGSWDKTVYPSVPDAGPGEAYRIVGPDSKGHGKKWKIGRFKEEQVSPGQNLIIFAAIDVKGKVHMVEWQPF